MKHAPSLESNTTCCELVGNAGPAHIRVPSLHFLYIVFFRLYNVRIYIIFILHACLSYTYMCAGVVNRYAIFNLIYLLKHIAQIFS